MIEKKELSPILERIMNRVNININATPDLSQWKELIARINNVIFDYDQERYLLERSMEISSREMLELNERFEEAQTIAHIGHWLYDRGKNKILWSKQTYVMFGLDFSISVPSFEEVMQMVYEKDRENLRRLIDIAFSEGKDFKTEIRVTNQKDNKLYWLFIKGHPHKKKNEDKYILSGIAMDITDRKNSEEEVKLLNQQLISIARKAGMSEIATAVLHNVGNVLNSVNISIGMIRESIINSNVKNLVKIGELISENLPKNPDYLINDPKGKLIPGYLKDFAASMISEYQKIGQEINDLSKNIQYIKDIVVKQNDISRVSGLDEKLFLPEIVDLAVHMSCPNPEKYGILIEKNYDYSPYVMLDKSKLLQILINLIQNAKDSLLLKNDLNKIINIGIKKQNTKSDDIEIIIQDNGVGISKKNMPKIFSMGFTTKITGHGFGLHSSALTANELGGSLSANSDGEGKGAVFVLTVPEYVKHKS